MNEFTQTTNRQSTIHSEITLGVSRFFNQNGHNGVYNRHQGYKRPSCPLRIPLCLLWFKGKRMITAFCSVLLCASAVLCAPPAAEITVKAKVSLADGSQFFGTPRFASLALAMDFAKLEIPLENVASLTFAKDGVKVGLYNKDVLSGKLEGTALAFDTVFNEARLDYPQIKSVTFSRQRNIVRNANEPGLLLYAPLDAADANLDLFGARMEAKNARAAEGIQGNALLLDTPEARVTIHLPFSPYTMPEGTVEFWAKLPQPHRKFSGGNGQPWFFNIESPGNRMTRHFVFGFAANDGTGRGGLVGRIHGLGMAATHYAGSVSSVTETGLLMDTPDGWHHYALIWKQDGVNFPGARGKSLLLVVDGRIVAVADKEVTATALEVKEEGIRLVIHDENSDCSRPLAVSDLKIWNYAKLPEPH